MSSSNWKPIIVMDASVGGKLTTVNPTEIVVLPECQARVDGTDDTLVAEYAADMREYDERIKESESEYPTHGWQEFPKINCIHVPDTGHILISGHHRLKAILQVGYTEILVYAVPGTRQDAIVWSKRQNADNGKRRTNADKAHVVKSCLLDDELKLWSNPTIAKWCGVSTNTVKNHEETLSKLLSENGDLYTRPTRRKRLSKSGKIEWVETVSIGNGSEKPNRKELKRKHHSAVVNVQSAFFTADLHEHKSFSHLPDKVQEFFKRIAFVKRRELRPNIFATNSSQDFLHETGKAFTNAEIEAEIEVLEKIASQIRWYGESEEHHLGWIERVLEMEPEQHDTEASEIERAKTEHTNAWSAVQSAFFDTDLDKHKRFSEFEDTDPGKKLYLFYKLTVEAKDMRLNTFSHNFYFQTGGEFGDDTHPDMYRGRDLTLAEIKAEAEFIQRIAKDIRFYQQGDDCHIGWIDKVLEMEPEQHDTDGQEVDTKPDTDTTPEDVKAEFTSWKERNNEHPTNMPDVEFHDVIEAHRYMKGDRDILQGKPATADEIKACYKQMQDDDETLIINARTRAFDRINLEKQQAEQEAYDALEKRIPKWKEKYASQGYSENELIQAATVADCIDAYIIYRAKNTAVVKTEVEVNGKLTIDGIRDLTDIMRTASFPYARAVRALMRERHPELVVEPEPEQEAEQLAEQTETDSPSLGEKTETLKLQIREYLPTWKQNNPNTVYATLFHLLDARFRIKHGIPRSRNPFFFEELEELLPLMKANDLELADKVRGLLETDASGVKSAAVESESPVEPEVTKETLLNEWKTTWEPKLVEIFQANGVQYPSAAMDISIQKDHWCLPWDMEVAQLEQLISEAKTICEHPKTPKAAWKRNRGEEIVWALDLVFGSDRKETSADAEADTSNLTDEGLAGIDLHGLNDSLSSLLKSLGANEIPSSLRDPLTGDLNDVFLQYENVPTVKEMLIALLDTAHSILSEVIDE